MLAPEHVRARRKGGELVLTPLDKKHRARAEALALELSLVAGQLVGERRSAFSEAFAAIEHKPSERRLVSGLAKLLLDACETEPPSRLDAPELRRRVFERAAAERRELPAGVHLDARTLLESVGSELGLSAEAVSEALYADLPSEERVVKVPELRPELLVEDYERAARQAILMRAVRVTADVVCRSPLAYRELFGKLKFRRLLHRIEKTESGYRISIDGPHSLFESVTKYGLALALVLPALEAVDELRLTAELRWGPRRERLLFRHEHRGSRAGEDLAPMSDDARELLEAFRALDTPWRVAPAERLFDVPGLGVCVPDLVFSHAGGGEPIHLEVLGYWSRDAVFRRVELVSSGLGSPMLFALSSRLRVSPEVLDEKATSALYVYKGVMSARAVERRLDALRARICSARPVV